MRNGRSWLPSGGNGASVRARPWRVALGVVVVAAAVGSGCQRGPDDHAVQGNADLAGTGSADGALPSACLAANSLGACADRLPLPVPPAAIPGTRDLIPTKNFFIPPQDLDGDGHNDLVLCSTSAPCHVLVHRGPFQFEDVTAAAGLNAPAGTVCGAGAGDLDNDGLPELILSTCDWRERAAVQLEMQLVDTRVAVLVYHNLGGARFEDVTTAWGFVPVAAHSAYAGPIALADLNEDGRLDVIVGAQFVYGDSNFAPRYSAYLSVPGGTWQEAGPSLFGARASETRGHAWGALFAHLDFNDRPGAPTLVAMFLTDGTPEAPARMYRRLSSRPLRFEELIVPSAFGDTGRGLQFTPMGATCAVIDSHGVTCLLSNSERESCLVFDGNLLPTSQVDRLWAANSPGRSGTLTTGWSTLLIGWSGSARPQWLLSEAAGRGALANPGDPTALYGANNFNLFNFDGEHFRREVLPAATEHRSDRGAAILDLDDDGRPDLLLGGFGAQAPLAFHNGFNAGRVLAVRLRGNGTSVPSQGVGAWVRVRAGGSEFAQEMVLSGQSAGGNGDVLYFGLGPQDAADSVIVRWPDGSAPTVMNGVPAGALTIRQN